MQSPSPSLRQGLRRFIVQVLCLFQVIYGYPLTTLAEAAASRPESAAFEERQDGPITRTVTDLSSKAGALLGEVGDKVGDGYQAFAHQPWRDTFAALVAIGANPPAGDPPDPSMPALPSGFAQARDFGETLFEGSVDKNALDALPLVPGLHLVSLPKEPASTDPATVLAALGGAYEKVAAFDGCDPVDGWKIFDPNDLASSDLTVLDHRKGFWITATAVADLPVGGTLPDSTTIPLCTGWNLIGFPSAHPRHLLNALQSIAGKVQRVITYEPSTPDNPWRGWDVDAPEWATDLDTFKPGQGYWVLVTEDTTLEIKNVGEAPTVAFTAPADLDVITQPTDVLGTVASELLDAWTLSYRAVGDLDWIQIGGAAYPVEGDLGTFDPTLLVNGLYELKLEAIDLAGFVVEEIIAVSVEGNMKVGHFTLSFVDLVLPLAGLDVEIVRTYDSRDLSSQDFGHGWFLELRQGWYRNNRAPGEGWRLSEGFLPCENTLETLSHHTEVRLSDREIYSFKLALTDLAPGLGGCYGRAVFEFVDGPLLGSTLEILDNDEVFWANASDVLVDTDSLQVFEPRKVRLETRDGRIFDLDLELGVERLQDLDDNTLTITPEAITHSSGIAVSLERDELGRITGIVDPAGQRMEYAYGSTGDLENFIDRAGARTAFTYDENHLLLAIEAANGTLPLRNEYDEDGRLIRHIDAAGRAISFQHDLGNRRQILTDRLGNSSIQEYDTRGNITRVIDPLGHESLRTYDTRDNPLTLTNAAGDTVHLAWDLNHRLLSHRDPLDQVTTWTYNDRGQPLTEVDPTGATMSWTYNDRGHLLTHTDTVGGVWNYTSDLRGMPASVKDPEGHTSTVTFDAAGRLTSTTDALGVTTRYTYDSNHNLLTETLELEDDLLLTTTHAYDSLDRRVQTISPDGSTWGWSFDLLGKKTSETDPLGRTTSWSYSPEGHLVGITHPDGLTEAMTWDAEGRRLSHTDRGGRTTGYTYDAVGRPVQTTFPDGTTEIRDYDAVGRPVAWTDGRGHVVQAGYDALGRWTTSTDALGQTVTYTYDAGSRLVGVTDPAGRTVAIESDAAGRPTAFTAADGSRRLVAYDGLGRRITETDEVGRTTAFAYDAEGQLLTVTDSLGGITRFTYDARGSRRSVTDALGRVTLFEYDTMGREVARILPDGSRETQAWDAASQRIRRTDFAGRTFAYEYDARGQLLRETLPGGEVVHTTYTPSGERTTETDSRGTRHTTYDTRDRPVEILEPDGRKLLFSYDEAGNRTSTTALIGTHRLETTYSYDAADRLATVTSPDLGTVTLNYDPSGRLAEAIYPNGLEEGWSYDPRGRLVGKSLQDPAEETLFSLTYTLGSDDLVEGVTESDGTERLYAYDGLRRLLSEESTGGGGADFAQSFTWDAVSNRLSTQDGAAPAEAAAYDVRDRLTEFGGLPLQWDAAGRLVHDGTTGTNYRWDSRDRLTGMTLADGSEIENLYDVDGNLIAVESTDPDGTTTRRDFLVDPSFQLSSQGGLPLSQVIAESSEGEVLAHYLRGDHLLGMEVDGAVRFAHGDALDSIRRLTDANGAVTDAYAYTAFGELHHREGDTANPFGFTGEYREQGTGSYYLRARWMLPTQGRFASMDPFRGFSRRPDSLHRYLYASANPLSFVDPTGLTSTSAAESSFVSSLATGLTVGEAQVAFTMMETAMAGGSLTLGSIFAGPAGSMLAVGIAAVAVRASRGIIQGFWALGFRGKIFKPGTSELTPGARALVWKLNTFVRGNAIEWHLKNARYKACGHIGATQWGFFPLIDFVCGKRIVSIKTTNGKNPGKAMEWLSAHMVDLAERGVKVAGKRVKRKDIRLHVAIPPDVSKSVFAPLMQLAKQLKVDLIIENF